MAFTQKAMSFTFSGANVGTLTVSGLRAVANIQASDGRLGTQAQIKVWGLSADQMNKYSTKLSAAVGVDQFEVVVEAGDLDSNLVTVVQAPIWQSYIDLADAPESAFVVNATGIYLGTTTIAAQSQPGAQNAEDLIGSLCKAASLTFSNPNGAHAVLRNQATYGSVIDQIDQIADAANFGWTLNGSTVVIWERGATSDATVTDVGPGTTPAMVGYPVFWEAGIIVNSLFNPQLKLGQKINVVGSVLANANGLWNIVNVQHSLSSMIDGGPWFTTAVLSAPGQ